MRSAIAAAVRAEPGIGFRELARRLGAGHGTLEYHLHRMEKAGLLRVLRLPGRTRYFDRETNPRSWRPALAAVELRILGLIGSRGLGSIRGVAEQLGLSYGEASYHLRKLRTAGLVDGRRGIDGLVLRLAEPNPVF